MMSLVLTLRCEPEQRLDLSLLVPDRLAGLTESDLSRIKLGTTRQPIAVGDIFTIRMGDAADIVIEGGSERLDQIGAAMTSGSLRVTGQAGARAARGMRGGSLVIDGDTGPFAAGMMRGGQVVIGGNAGPFLGAPGPGERAGMSGGVLLVRGHAGEHGGITAAPRDLGDRGRCRRIRSLGHAGGNVGDLRPCRGGLRRADAAGHRSDRR